MSKSNPNEAPREQPLGWKISLQEAGLELGLSAVAVFALAMWLEGTFYTDPLFWILIFWGAKQVTALISLWVDGKGEFWAYQKVALSLGIVSLLLFGIGPTLDGLARFGEEIATWLPGGKSP